MFRLTNLMYLQIDQLGMKLSLYFTPGSKISKGVEALFGKVDTFTSPLDKAMVQNISKGEDFIFVKLTYFTFSLQEAKKITFRPVPL